MNDKVKDKAALGRANTKKEQNKIAELLAIAGEGVGRVTPQDIKMKLEIIKGMNIDSEGKSRLDKMVSNARKKIKNKMTSDKAYTMKKGGEVKKYMGGGSVHKKKNKMLTTKGWGASRKT